MDATLNDFLNEINEIVPPVTKKTCDWQECFDEGTGFPYYWHVQTNKVTWEMPSDYKDWLEDGKTVKKTADPPKVEPLFPGVSLTTAPDTVKIYKIKEKEAKQTSPTFNKQITSEKLKKTKPPRKRSSDSEDERIVLISSYGGDTESEEEDVNDSKVKSSHSSQCSSPKPIINSCSNSRVNSDNEDEVVSLLPTVTEEVIVPEEKVVEVIVEQIEKIPSGIALVAGYGDSDEEEDHPPQENGSAEELSTPISHSTLFPITKPIDVNQFLEAKPVEKPQETEEIDTKVFQRKRRIGINFTNLPRRPPKPDKEVGRKGLGFKEDSTNSKKATLPVTFVKSDTLYPTSEPDKHNGAGRDKEDVQTTVKEKLTFLSEGRDAVSPVQTMLIQLETLYEALKYGSLDSNYLNKWIKETCEELVKLEEEAAPNGWLLQWDRSQKRYYYRNKLTDECQWDYPQAVADDDAMDICTTPPPPQLDSAVMEEVRNGRTEESSTSPSPTVNLETNLEPPSVEDIILDRQPLPPGVEITEPKIEVKSSALNFALDSFYSDIAAIENRSTSPKPVKINELKEIIGDNSETSTEPVKKKKKVKMASGISMKKKGVNKLVEKWKNVQKDLD